MRAAFHLHSARSYDGSGTPREWARWARRWGLELLVFTEHQGASLEGLPDELDGVRFVWTLEREDGRHHWAELWGVKILLHPGFPAEPSAEFEFYEAWNLKRDGGFPSKRVLRRFPGPFIAGCDLHKPEGEPVVVEFFGELPEALLEGKFVAKRGGVVLYPQGRVEAPSLAWALNEARRNAYRGAVKAARALGLAEPLRRLRRWLGRRR